MTTSLDAGTQDLILTFQKNEITEYHIYKNLAGTIKSDDNREVLLQMAEDERRHYGDWRTRTGRDVKPDRLKIGWYTMLGRILGVTFALKLMEAGEEGAQTNYGDLAQRVPEAEAIMMDENAHEEALLGMLEEERLQYTGSIVLGLNDALVELTGALAGLTLALQDTTLIALSASITGVAASMSMAASEYLSTKSEETTDKTPLKAAIYTGLAYVLTVVVLVLPYLLLDNYYVCLAVSLAIGIVIIAGFNYYVAVAKDESFGQRFGEMAAISLGIAALSFGAGYLIRVAFGVEV